MKKLLIATMGLLALAGCQSPETPLATSLNSTTPAVAAQARAVQELETQVERQQAVIESEKAKLAAIQQQLDGSRQTLDGLQKQMQATP